jgi:hypothetical protein
MPNCIMRVCPELARDAAEVEDTAAIPVGCQLTEVGQPDTSCARRQIAEVKTTSVPKQAKAACALCVRTPPPIRPTAADRTSAKTLR